MFLDEIGFKDKGFVFSVADDCLDVGNFCHHYFFSGIKIGVSRKIGAGAGAQ